MDGLLAEGGYPALLQTKAGRTRHAKKCLRQT